MFLLEQMIKCVARCSGWKLWYLGDWVKINQDANLNRQSIDIKTFQKYICICISKK